MYLFVITYDLQIQRGCFILVNKQNKTVFKREKCHLTFCNIDYNYYIISDIYHNCKDV
mgnify:FL=1